MTPMTLLAMTPVPRMRKPYARRWAALMVLCASMSSVMIATTSLLVAASSMAADPNPTGTALRWVIGGYTIPFASLMLICGATGDRYSRRGALIMGLIVFAAGSVAGALTDATLGVVLACTVMGVGAALVVPATLALVVATFPERERGVALTVWAATSALAVVVGPLVAGWLLERFTWHSIFLVDIPLAVAAIAGAVMLVPPSCAVDAGPFDWVGGLLSVVAVSTIVFAIIDGMRFGWTDRPLCFGFVGLLSVLGFVVWERRHTNPLLDLRVSSARILGGAIVAVVVSSFAMVGCVYLVAEYLRFALGYGPMSTGAHLLPLAGAVFAGSATTMWLTPRLGPRVTVSAGMLVGALSGVSFAGVDLTATYRDFLPMMSLLGFALGLAVSPCIDAVVSEFPERGLGVGGGVSGTALQVGGALGSALLGSAFLADTQDGWSSSFAGRSDAVGAAGDAVVHAGWLATAAFGIGAIVVGLLFPTKNTSIGTPSSVAIYEPIVPFFVPSPESAAAHREGAGLEELLEQPTAAPASTGPTVPSRAELRVTDTRADRLESTDRSSAVWSMPL